MIGELLNLFELILVEMPFEESFGKLCMENGSWSNECIEESSFFIFQFDGHKLQTEDDEIFGK